MSKPVGHRICSDSLHYLLPFGRGRGRLNELITTLFVEQPLAKQVGLVINRLGTEQLTNSQQYKVIEEFRRKK